LFLVPAPSSHDGKEQKISPNQPATSFIRPASLRVLGCFYESTTTDDKIHSFPSFETFSDMLTAVSSRAFGIGNHDDISSSMIALLDLCNHSRGKGDKTNLSYQWKEENGCVQVTSTEMIDSGGLLQITYGARGNGQLLSNYGFAIPKNLEPDNSSNDVFEFDVGNSTVIELRTGPKSYTYAWWIRIVLYNEQES
jgi:hypothetical protein